MIIENETSRVEAVNLFLNRQRQSALQQYGPTCGYTYLYPQKWKSLYDIRCFNDMTMCSYSPQM